MQTNNLTLKSIKTDNSTIKYIGIAVLDSNIILKIYYNNIKRTRCLKLNSFICNYGHTESPLLCFHYPHVCYAIEVLGSADVTDIDKKLSCKK